MQEDLSKMVFGLRGLGPRRKLAGYTQETFAEAVGCKRTALAMWEICRAWPSTELLPKMAMLLGCGIVDLFFDPEDEKSENDEGPPRAAAPTNDILTQEETETP